MQKGKKTAREILALIEERIWPTCSNYCDERSSHQRVVRAGCCTEQSEDIGVASRGGPISDAVRERYELKV
jgi:hypothetical protein